MDINDFSSWWLPCVTRNLSIISFLRLLRNDLNLVNVSKNSITVWMINHIQLSQELCSTTDKVQGKEDTDDIYLMKKLVLRRPRGLVFVTSWWLLLSLCVASCVHVTRHTADLILPGADHTGTAIPSQHHRRAHMCCTCQALGDGHTVTCRIGK